MASVGDVVFVRVRNQVGDTLPVCGWLLEELGEDLIVGCLASAVKEVAETSTTKVGQQQVGYLRIARASASGTAPTQWKGERAKDLPSFATVLKGWKDLNRELKSSEAEGWADPVRESPAAERRTRGAKKLATDLAQLRGLFGDDSDFSDEDEEEPTEPKNRRSQAASSTGMLAPGAAGVRAQRSKDPAKKPEPKGPDLQKMMALSLAQGANASDMMPLLMMNYLMEDKRDRQRRRRQRERDEGFLGGSSSEGSDADGLELKDKGMKAVTSLHRLQQRIEKRPKQIYQEFEREIAEELGIVAGQAWTLKDYLRRQPWGKFKGIYRCAVMDAQVYEYLRAGNSEAATAQLCQNMKAKVQAVLQQGDWSAAWLLTGLADPLAKKEFGGTKEELAIVSGYMDALAKLRKRMKETGHGGGILPERSGNSQPLFPGLLPYPEVLDCRGVPLESSAANWAKRLMNEFVAWSNFVVLGCPECRDSCYEPRVVYRSLEEVRLFSDRLLGEVMAFCSPDLLRDSLSLDGKRGDLDALLQTLARSMPSYDGTVPQAPPDSGVALPVLAERMAVPEEAGQVNPADWLDPLKAAVFENLESLRLPEEAWQEIPISCHRVPLDQEAAVMQKLLDTNMVVLVPESDLPRAQNGKLLVGGLFAVKKNSSEDRLIFDRRPENATMRRLRWASLPSGACFTRMLLRSNEYLRGSGDDLRNFYYALGLPETWIRYNAVGRRVDPKIVAAKGLDPRVPHRACFRVLGMGDVNACDVAQATHESILRDAGLLEPETVLVYGKSAPLTDIWEGVYLDDLLVARRCTYHSEVPLDGSFTPPPAQEDDEDMQRVAKAESAYQSAGLKRATHKAFRAEVQFKAWGAEVDGVLGRVSGPLAARRQVWVLIRKVVALGRCTKLALQRLLGLITFHLQFRRELFSLQHHVYKFLASMPDHEIVWLPSFVIDELRSLALHLPFCYTNLRRSIADKVLATDATPSSGGAVLASAPPALAEELWRLSEHRGEALRLDRGSAFLEDAGEPKAPSIFASVAAECMEWEPVASYHFRHTSHINLQEARALKRELVKFASVHALASAVSAPAVASKAWQFREIELLREKDLAFPDAIALGEESLGLVVIVKQPKTKRTYRTQMVLVKEARVVKWMYWWVRRWKSSESLKHYIHEAATQLGTEEVEPGLSPAEVLADSSSRTAASRWRSGSGAREPAARYLNTGLLLLSLGLFVEALLAAAPAWKKPVGPG
ncbi:unnamed protein product [Symbiodinium microadriaticum]|nr:unnamed protein product [Symbiodinium sp. KB8]CAE7905601.1 unnamed protein product [Symbiodinium microadriaticum]